MAEVLVEVVVVVEDEWDFAELGMVLSDLLEASDRLCLEAKQLEHRRHRYVFRLEVPDERLPALKEVAKEPAGSVAVTILNVG